MSLSSKNSRRASAYPTLGDNGEPQYEDRGSRSSTATRTLANPTYHVLLDPPSTSTSAMPSKEKLLDAILRPLSVAIYSCSVTIGVNPDREKRLQEMAIVVTKIKLELEADFEKLWVKQQKIAIDPSSDFAQLTAYKAMVDQANVARNLVDVVVISGNDSSKDKTLNEYRKKISLFICVKESLKQLFMILAGAAAGFLSLGYASLDANSAIAANMVGVGLIAGAAAGAVAGNYLYKHGRFFGASIIGNEYRLANAASAYIDTVNPADGVIAKAGRGIRKVF